MIRNLFVILLTLSVFDLPAQEASSFADLKNAKHITINKAYTFPASPKGFGSLQEFPKNTKRSGFYFEEERNSMWLTIDAPFNGILTFEIKPHSLKDDYDWMLFENSPDLKERLQKGTVKLLRSNNSRNDYKLKGNTGLKLGYTNFFEAPGLGKSYSSTLSVRKGQKLALVIDNIYEAGSGFDFLAEMRPVILQERLVSGVVTDKDQKQFLLAKIVCEDDSTGVRLFETTALKDGTYSIPVPGDRPVNITALHPGYIFQTFDLKNDVNNLRQDFNLTPISSTEKLILFNIHFTPDKDVIMYNSEPELERLVSLLKQESNWNIRVIGHTNNNPFADARYLQKLSFNRAIAVKEYLVRKGVEEKRISCIGVGGKSPIIGLKNSDNIWKNLRVEVLIGR
ncbi:MAG: OmpA family protein [Sphingobacteriaceae bacterium]|nr:OmpA family protein [Sphingobacteriaceae bacterium]